MPTEGDLVPSIVDLLEFNAAEVSDSRWDYDVDRLLWAIKETVLPRVRPSARKSEGQSSPPAASSGIPQEAKPQTQAGPIAQPHADRAVSTPTGSDDSSSTGDALDRKTPGHQTIPNRHLAPQSDTRGRATESPRGTEPQVRMDAELPAHPNKDEAGDRIQPHPTVHREQPPATAPALPEPAERIWTRWWRTARRLLRQRRFILMTTVGVGGLAVLVALLMSVRREDATIMRHLPNDLLTSCTATTDKSATCHLTDGTVVFFRLFDTATQAITDVMNGQQIAPDNQPCPPSAPPDDTPIVCRYAVGPKKGLAMFGYTAKDVQRYYVSRWVSDAEPRLRGEMSTENADPLDWTVLEANWNRLASTR